MARRVGNVRSRVRYAGVGFVAAIMIMAGLTGSSAQGQGSLPLQGSGFPAGDGAPVDGTSAGSGAHWNVLNWGPGR